MCSVREKKVYNNCHNFSYAAVLYTMSKWQHGFEIWIKKRGNQNIKYAAGILMDHTAYKKNQE